jgi:hypothetical protein
MGLTSKLNNLTRDIFFAAIIAFVFFLQYVVIQAQKISTKWETVNEQIIAEASSRN